MFPDLAYPGYTWPLTQHMGVVNLRNVRNILWAAATYSNTLDPAAEINNYIIANRLLTPNIRRDTGQPDAWRDYQQILSELGFIYSTEVVRRITLTPLGLAYLDDLVGFSEVMALQVLRYQYPNGHKLMIAPSLRRSLEATALAGVVTFAELQHLTGVQLRPAVLVWGVLRQLGARGEVPELTLDEIQSYLMRCSSHADTGACADAVVCARHSGPRLAGVPRGRRNAQDWIRFLLTTPLFEGRSGREPSVRISSYAAGWEEDIDRMCLALQQPTSFWVPGVLDTADRISWYAHFGQLDLGIPLIPAPAAANLSRPQEWCGVAREEDIDEGREVGPSVGRIQLRTFNPAALGSLEREVPARGAFTIDSSYDAGMAREANCLHDRIVALIGSTCRSRGAQVWDDPDSVDLLAAFQGQEFIIEVKTVTPRNFVRRLRYALGQLLHYDYLRSGECSVPRRKVIALAARLPQESWCIPFLNDHLDVDLVSLEGRVLRVDSRSLPTHRLLGPQQAL